MRDVDGTRDRPNDARGFIHKKILGGVGKVLGLAGNVIPLPGAGILRGAGDIFRGLARPRQPAPIQPFIQPFRPTIGSQASKFIKTGGPLEVAAEARKFAGTFPTGNGNGACPAEPTVCPPRGFHLNRSSYFLRDGTFIEKGSIFVRNRRLNNANGRAQDKAIVRLEKGQDHAKKLLKATGWRTISKLSSREMRNAKKATCK